MPPPAPVGSPDRLWLLQRATLALALMVGFYILALTASAALLWVAYAMFADLNPQTAPLFPLCLAGALSILWSIVPRPDRFVPPAMPIL